MSQDAHPRAVRFAAIAGFLLHGVAVLLVWRSWDVGLRGSMVFLIDLPVALFYATATQDNLLRWSLLLGGAQWALLTALLTVLVGRISARRRDERAPGRRLS